MKRIVISLFVLSIFLTGSLCSSNFRDFIRNDPFRNRAPVSFEAIEETTCGEFNCSYSSDCPVFEFSLVAVCNNSYCFYEKDFSSNICASPSQCQTNSSCTCQPNSPGPGCKCPFRNCVDSTCINGICQLAGGIGEQCDDGFCNDGVCTKAGMCEFLNIGDSCGEDDECSPDAYCGSGQICVERLACNATYDGYCPNGAFCDEGACHDIFSYTEGTPCLPGIDFVGMCEVGLTCVNITGEYVCTDVPLGSPCQSFFDCGYVTEGCFCTEPNNGAIMTCEDSGAFYCKQQYQDYLQCSVKYNCDAYDINDNTTDCGKNCMPLNIALACCGVCNYQEYRDNAWENLAGSCANNTVQIVSCCNPTEPCTIIATKDLCAGYSTKSYK